MSARTKKYRLKERSIALNNDYAVIVVGGGPAGSAAATAAARGGAKTLLIERTGALGGMGTLGLVPWFCGYDDGRDIIARGIAEQVRLGLCGGMPLLKKHTASYSLSAPAIDPELLKRIYDDLVSKAGASIQFHSQLCSVEMSDKGRIEARQAGAGSNRERV